MEESFLVLLSRIPGVGKKRAKRLIADGFSSSDAVLSARIEDIAMVAGIGIELAVRIKTFFEDQYLQDAILIVCPICGSLAKSDETTCPSCGAPLEAEREVEIETLDSLLEDLEKEIRVKEKEPPEEIILEEEEVEEPRVLARDFLERWKRIKEGEELPHIQKLEEQLSHYDRLLEVDPTLERAWLKKAELLVELGRYDEAIECYDKASELNPEMEEQYKIEVLNILRSKEDVSLVPEVAEEISPQDVEAIERAIRHYDALLKLDPTMKMAWQTKGELLEKLRRHEEAIECYGKATGAAALERVRDIRKLATLSRRGLRSRRVVSRGLVNGLGRTNGLVNGLVNGKVNGLVNGLGKVNGLVNGLVNGVGKVNGLVNGLINGNGLVNGRARRVRPVDVPRSPVRWSRGVVGMAAVLALLIMVPMLGSILVPSEKGVIEIDGEFGDWLDLSTKSSPIFTDDSGDQPTNSDINLLSYRLYNQSDHVYLFAEVQGMILNGSGENGLDSIFVLIDRDRDPSTGYRAAGMGIDDLVHISGWNNSCGQRRLFEFTPSTSRDDWYGFRGKEGVSCAARNDRLEVSFYMDVSVGSVLLATKDVLGNMDVGDSIISLDHGALTLDVETVAPEIITQGEFPVLRLDLRIQATSLDLLTLNLSKKGNLSDTLIGVALFQDTNGNDIWEITDSLIGSTNVVGGNASLLVNMSSNPLEGNISLFAVAQLSSMPQGHSFGLELQDVAADAPILVRRGFQTTSYIMSAPNVTIDGAFADWKAPLEIDLDNDVIQADIANTTLNENIDLRNFASHRGENFSLYLEIDQLGTMLGGDIIPAYFERPSPYVPPYLDSDRDSVPDNLDGPGGVYRFDFDNDGEPDASEAGDVDSDGQIDYPLGNDYWLETVIPSNFTEPYANQSISVYIGPSPARVSEGLDRVVIYLDRDGSSTGYQAIVDGLSVGYDFMFLVTGKGGAIDSAGVFTFNESSTVPWEFSMDLDAAVDSHRMEVGVSSGILNLTDDFVAHVYMIDWTRSYDRSDTGLTNLTTKSRTRSPQGDNVVLNEIHPDKKNKEWIELANPTNGTIDISGWELVVDGTSIYTFPAGTTIGAYGSGNEFLTVDFTGNQLPNGGANVRLMNGSTNVDDTTYPGIKASESWSRYREAETGKPLDTDSPSDWYVSGSPTKGEENDQTKPSMVVKKVADKLSAAPGEEVTYILYYNNTGSSKARNVWLNDTLPDGVTFVDSDKAPDSVNGNTYRWYFGTVPRTSGNSITMVVRVNDTVGDGANLTNSVTLNYTNENGVWQQGSYSQVSFSVSRPVISVVKTVDKTIALPGEQLIYTIFYNNTGSANAAHVWVNDTLPNNVTFVSSSEPYESQTGNTYVWHFMDVTPGAHSFTITVTVDLGTPSGNLINWAFLNYTTQNLYGLDESSDSALTYIPEFQDIFLPVIVVMVVFAVIRRRRMADGFPRTNDR